jgi:hypothetical protein
MKGANREGGESTTRCRELEIGGLFHGSREGWGFVNSASFVEGEEPLLERTA